MSENFACKARLSFECDPIWIKPSFPLALNIGSSGPFRVENLRHYIPRKLVISFLIGYQRARFLSLFPYRKPSQTLME